MALSYAIFEQVGGEASGVTSGTTATLASFTTQVGDALLLYESWNPDNFSPLLSTISGGGTGAWTRGAIRETDNSIGACRSSIKIATAAETVSALTVTYPSNASTRRLTLLRIRDDAGAMTATATEFSNNAFSIGALSATGVTVPANGLTVFGVSSRQGDPRTFSAASGETIQAPTTVTDRFSVRAYPSGATASPSVNCDAGARFVMSGFVFTGPAAGPPPINGTIPTPVADGTSVTTTWPITSTTTPTATVEISGAHTQTAQAADITGSAPNWTATHTATGVAPGSSTYTVVSTNAGGSDTDTQAFTMPGLGGGGEVGGPSADGIESPALRISEWAGGQRQVRILATQGGLPVLGRTINAVSSDARVTVSASAVTTPDGVATFNVGFVSGGRALLTFTDATSGQAALLLAISRTLAS
jgi:hypothetical protein